MRFRRLYKEEYDWDAAGEKPGDLFVDDNGFVRYIDKQQQDTMRGAGPYSGATGYEIYEDDE